MNKPGSASTFKPLASRRRRQPLGPRLFAIGAVVLVVIGLIAIGSSLIGPGKPISNLFATDTPTPTPTLPPTSTATATEVPTETLTPTVTFTPTPGSPFQYTVQEGEYLATIVDKFGLGPDGIELIQLLNPYGGTPGLGIDPTTNIVYPNQIIWIPNPGMELPTATPIPPDLARGTRITYIVKAGDTLGGIAARFNSTEEAILAIAENNLTDPNALFVGQSLIIPVNMVTPTQTRPPTSTPITPTAPSTPTATNTP